MNHLLIALFSVLLLSACVTENTYEGSDKPVVEKKINNLKVARTRITLALKYLSSGDSQQAKYNLERALKFAPELAEVHYTLAYYYQQVGENQLAKKAFQDALKINRNDPNTLHNYGTFLCRIGEYTEAEELLLKAIAIPSYLRVAESYENLALCSIEDNQFEKAQEYLIASVKHSPSRSTGQINLAALYYAKSDLHKAQAIIKRFEKSGGISSRSLLLSYLVETRMGNLEYAGKVKKLLLTTYNNSSEANMLRDDQTFKSEFEQLRKQYRRSELNKLQREIARNKIEPKIKVVKKKVPTSPVSDTAEAPKSSEQPTTLNELVVDNDQVEKVEVLENKESQPEKSQEQLVTEQIELPKANEPETDTQLISKFNRPSKTVWKEDIKISSVDNELDEQEIQTPFHVVEKGENLFSISVKYNVKLKTLLEWNNLRETDQVMVGSKVYLNNPKVYHVVADGETLFSISVRYNILMAKLIEWNKLGSNPRLHPGKKLILVNPITYRL